MQWRAIFQQLKCFSKTIFKIPVLELIVLIQLFL